MLPPQGNIVLQCTHLPAVALDAGCFHRHCIVRLDAAQSEQDLCQQSLRIRFQFFQHRIPVLQQAFLISHCLPAGNGTLQVFREALQPLLNPVPQAVRLAQQYQIRLKPVAY